MKKSIEIIKSVSAQEKRVILFHSASGKDSIALLDIMHPYFDEIVCVFMYTVRNLSHINRYINYAKAKYPKARFIQVPHFAVYSYIKHGYLGCEQNPKQRLFRLSDISQTMCEKLGIEWSFYGFKQSDGLNRRLMLRAYDNNAINHKNKKCYPLSEYKNKDVLDYIKANNLITPERYGNGASSGTNISDIDYLMWLKKNFPEDLEKVINEYPQVERLLFEYEYEKNKGE